MPPSHLKTRGSDRRVLLVLVILVIGAGALLPIFKWNQLSTADPTFFNQFDLFSESLVLAKIESTSPSAVAPNIDRAGLMIAGPDAGKAYSNFNQVAEGEPPAPDAYLAYMSNLGLQGFAFLGLYDIGCTSIGCLETVNSGFTALSLIGFTLLLGTISRRSFAGVFLVAAVGSPWIVASARNLYWVPFTWFLPAIAAICFTTATSPRKRLIGGTAAFFCFAFRFGTGFEFITSIALLACAMPMLAHIFGRSDQGLKRASRDAGLILAIAVAAFGVVLIALAVDLGAGNVFSGIDYILADAAKRTYGGTSTDPLTAMSLQVPVSTVAVRYLLGWGTDVIVLGKGSSLAFVLDSHSLWWLIILSSLVVLVRLWARDSVRYRDLFLLSMAVVIPMSWFILAKSHSAMHTGIDYVLWYLLGVSTLVWLIAAYVGSRLRTLLRPDRVNDLPVRGGLANPGRLGSTAETLSARGPGRQAARPIVDHGAPSPLSPSTGRVTSN